MDSLEEQFGALLRRRREGAGLSQEKLAEEAGLHRTYISLLERGHRQPTITVVSQLAKALGTTMTSMVAELEGVEEPGAADEPPKAGKRGPSAKRKA